GVRWHRGERSATLPGPLSAFEMPSNERTTRATGLADPSPPANDEAPDSARAAGVVRTPPHPAPPPRVGADPEQRPEPDAPEAYLNRELTWLNFAWRVVHEGVDDRTPLLERMKFLGIVGSTLDEFFMKRIGGL